MTSIGSSHYASQGIGHKLGGALSSTSAYHVYTSCCGAQLVIVNAPSVHLVNTGVPVVIAHWHCMQGWPICSWYLAFDLTSLIACHIPGIC